MVCLVILVSISGPETYDFSPRAILRRPKTIPTDWRADGGSCSVDER